MKKFVSVFAALFCAQAQAGEWWQDSNFYIEAGMFYNRKATGIVSNYEAHFSGGYEIEFTDSFSLDFELRHRSDPENQKDDEKVSLNTIGVVGRFEF